ncbi:MAG TPA: endonuclease/exonuclease/phosphatase family protein [Gemmatimonadaceae bacterium]|nr:endonuclease/exonuclease/phosphatase family protein [Gemmatimonadaceae bacterium]
MIVRVLSYNIRYGGVAREAALAAVVRAAAPDVVMLQEASVPTVVAALAEAAAMPHWGARERHSTAFLSRLPVAHHAWHHPVGSRHAFLEVALAGVDCRLFGLHLRAWFSRWSERRRARELRALLRGIRAHQHGMHVIAGDFNALAPGERLHVGRFPAWIQAMIWLSGRDIARETIQLLLDEGYVDAWRLRHPDEPGVTFPTWDPHVRLDYLFAPEREAHRLRGCAVLRAPAEVRDASDHFPLLVELALEPRPSAGDAPDAAAGDVATDARARTHA